MKTVQGGRDWGKYLRFAKVKPPGNSSLVWRGIGFIVYRPGCPIMMTDLHCLLQTARRYLELKSPLQAQEVLRNLPRELKTCWRVLVVQVQVHQALEEWEAMEHAAEALCAARPSDSQWHLALAEAVRRRRSLAEAMHVMENAANRFPDDVMIRFKTVCFNAQLGYLNEAREQLREIVEETPEFLLLALVDPDLTPLYEGAEGG